MGKKNQTDNRKRIRKLPKLRLRYRLLLYFFTAVFVALATVSAALQCFSETIAVVFYFLAAVFLTAGCYYLVRDIRHGIKEIIKPKVTANPYTNRLVKDYRFRTVISAVPGLAGNIIFAVFNGVIGIISHSAWFGSLAAYYILLSMMRIGAVKQEREISKIPQDDERMRREISRIYHLCGGFLRL